MNPNQPSQPNPYDFITSPGQPAPKAGKSSTRSRLVVIAVGILLLVILASVAFSFLGSADRTARQNLKNIVAEQEELIRVAALGIQDAQSADVKGRAYIVSTSVQTSQQEIISLLESGKASIEPQEKVAKKDSKTDEALSAAAASNRYDEAFTAILDEKLEEYLQSLKTTYDGMSGEKSRTALSSAYSSASIILAKKSE